jgi:uncharacterized protein (TIGR03437 family)
MASAGVAAFFIPAWNESIEAAETCVPAMPTVTEGPYWVDEKLFRSDIRTDPTTGFARAGVPLTLNIIIQNLTSTTCTPLAGAYVDIWHCDAKGIYSDESTYNPGGGTGTVTTSGQKFLRGYQITDSTGKVTFTTIYPGWYTGRTIHIHFRVRTYNGSTVLGNFVSQIFFDDNVNNVVLATSAYSRSSNRDTTNARDMVYQVANKERMLANVSGDNTTGYTADITAGVSIAAPAVVKPTIAAGGIGNAFSGAAGIAPGSWISLYGTNFSNTTRTLTVADLVDNTIPTTLGGVSVRINGRAAYVQYVSPNQINAIAPADASAGPVSVTTTNSAGTSDTVTANLQQFLPGLVAVGGFARAIRYPDGAIINGTGKQESGYITSAAVGQGEIVSLYGTGFGPTNSDLSAGAVFAGGYPTTESVTFSIGGAAAEVLWAGLVSAGVYQINVRVPSTLADGTYEVIASVAGLSSPSSVKLSVAAGAKLTPQILAGQQKLIQRLSPYARESLRRLEWLGGLTPQAQHETGTMPLRRARLQAAEAAGGLIKIA